MCLRSHQGQRHNSTVVKQGAQSLFLQGRLRLMNNRKGEGAPKFSSPYNSMSHAY